MKPPPDMPEPEAPASADDQPSAGPVGPSWAEVLTDISEFSGPVLSTLGRAMLDAEFRDLLLSDPSRALLEYSVNEPEASYLKLITRDQLEQLREELMAELSQFLDLANAVQAEIVAEAESWRSLIDEVIPDDGDETGEDASP
jgi:hypothetical protein